MKSLTDAEIKAANDKFAKKRRENLKNKLERLVLNVGKLTDSEVIELLKRIELE